MKKRVEEYQWHFFKYCWYRGMSRPWAETEDELGGVCIIRLSLLGHCFDALLSTIAFNASQDLQAAIATEDVNNASPSAGTDGSCGVGLNPVAMA
jgi:hypothetical protein